MLRELSWVVRSLRRSPSFAVAALATLTLGIGANTAVFSFVNGVLLRPLPFGEVTDRLVSIHSIHPTQFPDDWDDARISWADFDDVRRQSETLEDVAVYFSRSFTLYAESKATQVRGGSISPNLFRLLTVRPALGRDFRDGEGAAPGFEHVVILSHGLWQNRLGANADIIGDPILVNGRELTVVGVMPPSFRFPEFNDLWVPYHPRDPANRGARVFGAVAVLRADLSLSESRNELVAIAERLAESFPETNLAWGLHVLEYRDSITNPVIRVSMTALLGAVGMVLVIGCANLASLLLARGQSRQSELAVHAALGASRARLMRPVLLECLLLSLVGGVLGTIMAAWSVDFQVANFPEELPYWITFPFDGRVAVFVVGLSLVTSLTFGLVPAFRGSRVDLLGTLGRGSARTTGARNDLRLQDVLVAGQIALSLAVVTSALLMIQSFLSIQNADAGFDEDHLLSLRVYLSGDEYDPATAKLAFFQEAERRLEAIPGVVAAGVTTSVPADDGGFDLRIVTRKQPIPDGSELGVQVIATTTRLFDALGVDLLSGRGFRDQDLEVEAPRVAILNEALANKLGFELTSTSEEVGLVGANGIEWYRIIGLAPHVQYEEFSEETAQSRLNVYVPYTRFASRSMAFMVRAEGDPELVTETVRKTMQQYAPTVPVYLMQTMNQVRFIGTWQQRFFGQVFGLFGVAAVALSGLGVYGLMSFLIGGRLRDIAIRLAFGAQAADIVRPMLRRGARLAGWGLAIGLIFALVIARWLASILYKVSPYQAWWIVIPALVLVAAVLVATYLPTRRATRVHPASLLRHN